MMLRECTEDVTAVQTWRIWDRVFVAASELTGIIAALNKMGQVFFLLTKSTSPFGCVVFTMSEKQYLFEQVLH